MRRFAAAWTIRHWGELLEPRRLLSGYTYETIAAGADVEAGAAINDQHDVAYVQADVLKLREAGGASVEVAAPGGTVNISPNIEPDPRSGRSAPRNGGHVQGEALDRRAYLTLRAFAHLTF